MEKNTDTEIEDSTYSFWDIYINENKTRQFCFYALPALMLALVCVHFITPLDWITVPGGDPSNPFAGPAISELVFNLKTFVGITSYAPALSSLTAFLFFLKRIYQSKPFEARLDAATVFLLTVMVCSRELLNSVKLCCFGDCF